MFSPFLLIALAFAFGIGAGDFFFSTLSRCLGPLAAAVAAAVAAALLAARHGGRNIFAGLLILSAFLLGIIHLLADTTAPTDDFPSDETLYTATLRQVHKEAATHRTLDVVLSDGKTVRLYDYSAQLPLHTGDTLIFKGRITLPRPADFTESFDYLAYLRRHHIAGTATVRHLAVTGTTAGFSLPRLRERLVDQLSQQFEGTTLQILSATALGSRASMPDDVRETFRLAGASHALALSGMHLGILFMLFETLVTRRMPGRRLRLVAGATGLALVWAFTALTGAPLSLQRAALMCTIYKAAQMIRHDADTPTSLAMAAVIILTADPQALFDAGFQLSFAAVAGILWFVPRWRLRRRHPERKLHAAAWRAADMLWNTACVSLAAGLTTLPLVAWHFHAVPVYGLLSSFLVVPALYILLSLILFYFLLPPLQAWLAPVLSFTADTLFGGLKAIAALPHSSLPLAPDFLFIPAFYLLAAALSFRKYIPAATAALLMAAACLPHPLGPQIIIYDTAPPLVHCLADRHRSCLWTPARDKYTAAAVERIGRDFWTRKHIRPPQAPGHGCTLARLRGGVLCFDRIRIAVAGKTCTPQLPSGIRADILYITGHTAEYPEQLLARLRPSVVVASRRLSEKQRHRLKEAAQRAGTRLHDLRTQGAFRQFAGNPETP